MKTILQLQLTRVFRFRGTFLALLAICLAADLAATHAASASLQPLVHPGKWPTLPPDAIRDVKVVGNYAYVALGLAGLAMIDVSNPANCVRVGGYDTSGSARGVAVVAGRIYVADGQAGLVVLSTLPNVQFTVRVDATPGTPFTLEAATDLSALNPWRPLVTTNVPAMPFDYVDFDVKLSQRTKKFYRVRQP